MHSVWYWLNRYLHAKLELSIFMAFDWAVTLNANKEHTVLSNDVYNGVKAFMKSYLDFVPCIHQAFHEIDSLRSFRSNCIESLKNISWN